MGWVKVEGRGGVVGMGGKYGKMGECCRGRGEELGGITQLSS